MKRKIAKMVTCFLIVLTLSFLLPASLQAQEGSFLTPAIKASALLSADDPELTKEKVEQEMYERYKEIFDFVSQEDISIDAQAVPLENTAQASGSEIDSLAAELTADCSTDYDKAAALYNWIISNLYYDYDYYNGVTSSTNITASDAFANKNTVCEGFANLYTAMCRSVGVPCRKVIGYSVSAAYSDGEYFDAYFVNESNHAWNEIYVNDAWIVVDATWDCGNTYENGVYTEKSRSVKWFGMDFEEFSQRHMGKTYCNSFQSDEYTFSVDNNIVTASNYIGSARKIIIPEGVHVITEISKTKTDFTSVVLPSTLTSISSSAFKNCTSLINFVVPEGVTNVGNNAFNGCSAITSISLPSTLKSIGSGAFRNCSALTEIAIPDGIEEIPSAVFYGCSALEEINIPSSVKKIGASAFRNCVSLRTVTVPESVTSLGASAFQDCTGLESVELNCKVSLIPGSCFGNCTALASVYISPEVTEIGSNAFKGCAALKTITGAQNIKILRYQAFMGCTLLENCDFFNKLTRLEYWAFRECENITSVTIPFTYSNIDEYSFYNCKALEKVVIEGNVTTIDEAVFYKCESLKEVVIPSTVTAIGEFAFADCTSLEEIDLPDGLTSISPSLFSGCVKLKSIGEDIPSAVTSIGEYAFYDCVLEGEYTIPDSVTLIPKSAFYQCEGINKITIPVSVTAIDEFAFTRAANLTDVYYIGTEAQWEGVTVGTNNSAFLGATFHFMGDHTHSYSSEVTTNATCTSSGVMTYTCSCGDEYTQVIESLGHAEERLPEVKATCTGTGLTAGVKCSVCGEVITPQTLTSKLAHIESEWITDTPATCSKEGTKHTECTACRTEMQTAAISKLSHTEVEVPEVKATCTNTGLTAGVKCSVCGEIITAQTVTSKLAHTESEWITDTDATCSKEGTRHTECTACRTEMQTAAISKLSHTEEVVPEVKATCTGTGLTAGDKCSVCGEIITAQTVTSKLAHTESEWITDTPATCSKEGTKHTECTACRTEMQTAAISKLSHTEEVVPEVKATCRGTGLTAGVKCSVCGEVITPQTVTPKLSHIESSWITDSQATCSAEGKKHTICLLCDKTLRTSGIEKLSHKDNNNDNKCDMCSVSTNPVDKCSHMCHKGGFSGFIWSIIKFFSKLFGSNKVCECGAEHY
ncbi:MAG: leucine-rich repeat protein [Clostridia bacterium]|nr:leucine-rich repeat protein [Clostridia bacterium]